MSLDGASIGLDAQRQCGAARRHGAQDRPVAAAEGGCGGHDGLDGPSYFDLKK
jgi:hypothetical protein